MLPRTSRIVSRFVQVIGVEPKRRKDFKKAMVALVTKFLPAGPSAAELRRQRKAKRLAGRIDNLRRQLAKLNK